MSSEPSRLRIALVAAHGIFILGIVSWLLGKGRIGVDFAVFHLGGAQLRLHGYDAVYDSDRFQQALVDHHLPGLLDSGPSATSFISPPPFAWVMQAVSFVPFGLGIWLWLIGGAAAVVVSVRWLGLGRKATILALVSPAFVNNFGFGQSGPFFLLIVVAVHKCVEADRKFVAGLIGGLLIVKPTIAVGLAIWWLLDMKRWYPAIGGALISSGLLVAATVTDGFGPWRSYVEAISTRVDIESGFQAFSPSIAEFLKLLAPGAQPWLTLVFWLVSLLAGLVVMRWMMVRYPGDAVVLSAAAAVVTVLSSPHLLVYDTLILIIPLAVAWQRGLIDEHRTELLLAIFTGGLALGPLVYSLQFDLFGRGVGAEMPAFVLCLWLVRRWILATDASEEAKLVPVVANR